MKSSIYLSVIAFLTMTVPAHAYIDPITGSVILQAIIGGIAAASIAIRRVREKILGWFGIKSSSDSSETDENDDQK